MKITVCDIIGHKYNSTESAEHGDCSRCRKQRRHYTDLEMFVIHEETPPLWVYLFPVYLFYRIKEIYQRSLCKCFGHKWQENGYAGPDSGHTWVECQRCDESHNTIMY